MSDFFTQSVFFGAFLSLLFYEVGVFCKKKWKKAFLNPLLISVVLTIAFLLICKIPVAFPPVFGYNNRRKNTYSGGKFYEDF